MSEEVIVVEGTGVLSGTVRVSGAKNSALKLMAAALLGQGKCVLHNVPQISDIEVMSDVLRRLGATVQRDEQDPHTLIVDTAAVTSYETPYELVSKMRASISVLGPLIGRFGRAHVAMPGGCQISARKIDMHLLGLEKLGVRFEVKHGDLQAQAPDGLRGAYITLDFPSVGATENMLMASVVAQGETVIDNAAREPEIVDLCNMLNAMGACVSGGGTSTITVEGLGQRRNQPSARMLAWSFGTSLDQRSRSLEVPHEARGQASLCVCSTVPLRSIIHRLVQFRCVDIADRASRPQLYAGRTSTLLPLLEPSPQAPSVQARRAP